MARKITALAMRTLFPSGGNSISAEPFVFIYPTSAAGVTQFNKSLPLSMMDYPHESARTAIYLNVSGRLRLHASDCRIVLSHRGGTLPMVDLHRRLSSRRAQKLSARRLGDSITILRCAARQNNWPHCKPSRSRAISCLEVIARTAPRILSNKSLDSWMLAKS